MKPFSIPAEWKQLPKFLKGVGELRYPKGCRVGADGVLWHCMELFLNKAVSEPGIWVERSGKKRWTSFRVCARFGQRVKEFLSGGVELDVEGSGCHVVSQKQVKVMKGLLFCTDLLDK